MAEGFNTSKKYLADQMAANGFRAILLKSTYAKNDAHEFVDDIIAEEAVDGNAQYPAGGVVLTNVVVTQDDANDRANINADDILIEGVNILDYQFLVIASNGGNDATDRLWYFENLGAQSQSGGNISLPVPADFIKQS